MFAQQTSNMILVLYTTDRELLRDRLSLSQRHHGPFTGQACHATAVFLLASGWLVLMPLDPVRFHWSHVPLLGYVIGAVLVASSLLAARAMLESTSCGRTAGLRRVHDLTRLWTKNWPRQAEGLPVK